MYVGIKKQKIKIIKNINKINQTKFITIITPKLNSQGSVYHKKWSIWPYELLKHTINNK